MTLMVPEQEMLLLILYAKQFTQIYERLCSVSA